jgi:hypothetical protein
MVYPDDRMKDLVQDAKAFASSEYGQYIKGILEQKAEGYLTSVGDVNVEHPERFAAKFGELKEVINLLFTPLDDDTPSQS